MFISGCLYIIHGLLLPVTQTKHANRCSLLTGENLIDQSYLGRIATRKQFATVVILVVLHKMLSRFPFVEMFISYRCVSFLQPYSQQPCSGCKAAVTKSRSAHWEGGKGCRDKLTMSRWVYWSVARSHFLVSALSPLISEEAFIVATVFTNYFS